jgi:endonuclease YncB( thermonuclease family)
MKQLLILACFFLGTQAAHAKNDFIGNDIKIIDGDTFVLCNETSCNRIRLCGIDAPERGKSGYSSAKLGLSEILDGKTVKCVFVGNGSVCDGRSKGKSRDRLVAQCFVGDMDVASELVKNSYACAWPKFSGDHYSKISNACVK